MDKKPKIAALGGGTGLSTMLRGLKLYTPNITAIITMSDDGGGSGKLRDDLGMLPPGDVRSCLLALSNMEPKMEELFRYRFSEGSLSGQSFGNLLIAALNGIYNNFEEAIKCANEVLAVTGRVLPVTSEDIRLCAEFDDGNEVLGESKIAKAKIKNGGNIKRVKIIPQNAAPANHVIEGINEADLIILGPGSLYTSIIPNLLIKGVADAIRNSPAPKIYICNVMTQPGETEDYSAFDHVKAILEHGGDGIINYCIVNTGKIDTSALKKYASDSSVPVYIDRDKFENAGIKIIMADVADKNKQFARHNPYLLTKVIEEFYENISSSLVSIHNF